MQTMQFLTFFLKKIVFLSSMQKIMIRMPDQNRIKVLLSSLSEIELYLAYVTRQAQRLENTRCVK